MGLLKSKFWIATAAASVTTARLTPRTRSADTAVSIPTSRAAAVPMMGAKGKPIPALTARCEMTKPAIPASESWTTEIWPTNPVSTTNDSAITVPISVLISASRKSNGSTTRATRAHRAGDQRGPHQVARPGDHRQAALDEIAAPRQAGAAQEHHRDDDEEDEELRDAGDGDPPDGGEPRLRARVLDQRLQDPQADPGGAGERRTT